MRIVHINVMATLSTGRVATEICETAQEMGHRTLVAFSRGYPPRSVPYLRIGNGLDLRLHGVLARLTDRSGFFSRYATRKLVRQLKSYKPDLIHLHNLHGYYLHLPTLFGYLKECGVPVVWTLHDCWAFTGHCAYFSMARCDRWLSGCGHCPCQHLYPNSLFWDRSSKNWAGKRALFTAVPGLALVTPSEWLASEVSRSYLKKYPLYVIPNGIDLQTFRPCDDPALLADTVHRYHLERLNGRRMLLSVASTWEPRKGLEDLA
ncbi:MAG: glycosyltransferase, partial [Eubacteriales bacterium]|nr:glycosyltransferase [Eubacteriales bacterium]